MVQHIQATGYTKGRGGKQILWLVVHDMEAPENLETAENVAKWFARADAKTSAHECIDANSVVTCVHEVDTAWAAPGANQTGYHYELAGYARQTRAEWLDPFSKATLQLCAQRMAEKCVRLGIPVRRLTVTQIRNGNKGIVGHADLTAALGKGTHQDPGPNFPWDIFLPMVQKAVRDLTAPSWWWREIEVGMRGEDVKHAQKRLVALGFMPNKPSSVDGIYGNVTSGAVKKFQTAKKLGATGRVDAKTAKTLG